MTEPSKTNRLHVLIIHCQRSAYGKSCSDSECSWYCWKWMHIWGKTERKWNCKVNLLNNMLKRMLFSGDTSQGCRSEREDGWGGGHWLSGSGAVGRHRSLWKANPSCRLLEKLLVALLQAFLQGKPQKIQLLGALLHPQLSLMGRRTFRGYVWTF